MGLEALSRGAGRATFVDMSPKCTGAIAENGERLGFHERVQVVEARVRGAAGRGYWTALRVSRVF